MSALCAFPLIPAVGGVYSANYHDVSRGVVLPTYQQQSQTRITIPSYNNNNNNTFYQAAKIVRMAADSSSAGYAPQAKKRCTRPWPEQPQQQAPLWPSCPSGCTACLQQQQFDSRRPLQEKHQNREEVITTILNNKGQQRALSVDPKKDYSTPLQVDCSVEYDLPRIVRPPPGAQPLLILATRPVQQPTNWQQWNQQPGNNKSVSSVRPAVINHSSVASSSSANTVKSHPVVQQQQQQKINQIAVRNNTVPCGCPSCCLAAVASRPYPPPPPPPQQQQTTMTGGWMNQWSPPAGTTASSALNYPYQQPHPQQQQQQMLVAGPIDQQQQQTTADGVNPRRRKRSTDKMQRLYSSPWMSGSVTSSSPSSSSSTPSIQQAIFFHQAAAANGGRYTVATSPWITSAQPLKFHC